MAASFAPLSGVSVAVDARGIRSSGIGRYIREVVAVLLRDRRFGRILLLGDTDVLHAFAAEHAASDRVDVRSYPGTFYSPRSQLAWLALRARGMDFDVAFFPHYDTPLFALPRRSVVTVHDLTHFKVPEAFAAWRRVAAGVLLRRAVQGAARVITGSEAARRDLIERFPDSAPIDVVPHGVSSVFGPLPESERAGCGSIAELSPFLLCVGNRKPHKNLVAAVKAFALVRQECPEARLVFAGRSYRGWEAVIHRVDELGLSRAVVDLGEVSDAQLNCLYTYCEALLFPSLYEGFGLPVLEAMACGAAVISSDRASLPEVVGDAGLLVDPHDHVALASAILRLQREPGLRRALTLRGQERAAAFTWEAAGRRTVDLLYEVATQNLRAPSSLAAATEP